MLSNDKDLLVLKSKSFTKVSIKEKTPHLGLPFLDEETFTRFGYYPSSLASGSHKKVVVQCSICNKILERTRSHIQKEYACSSCAQLPSLNKRFYSIEGLPIDKEATIKAYGYNPEILKPSSNKKKVIIKCIVCGELVSRSRGSVRTDSKCLHHELGSLEITEKKIRTLVEHYGENALKEIASKRKKTIIERYDGTPFIYKIKNKSSGAEIDIKEVIEKAIGQNTTTRKILPSGREIDIYVPEYNLGIEFHGLHWHHEMSPAPRGPSYHLYKYLEAKTQGIRLIQIFEDEWRDRKPIVEQLVLSALKKYGLRTYARKCLVKNISVDEARDFMKNRHLQGASHKAVAAQGLFFKGNLVGAMTMAHHHYKPGEYAMDRLCFDTGLQVVGGASKLSAALSENAKEMGIKRLWTWSDNRWSEGDVYQKMGYLYDGPVAHSYDYVNIKNPKERIPKQSRKRSVTGCPPDVTEREWALKDGLARIWDCGKKRWLNILT